MLEQIGLGAILIEFCFFYLVLHLASVYFKTES